MALLLHTASHSLHDSWSWVTSTPLLRKNHKKSEQSARAALLPNPSPSPRRSVSCGAVQPCEQRTSKSTKNVGLQFFAKVENFSKHFAKQKTKQKPSSTAARPAMDGK
jgi:hypothetical protein